MTQKSTIANSPHVHSITPLNGKVGWATKQGHLVDTVEGNGIKAKTLANNTYPPSVSTPRNGRTPTSPLSTPSSELNPKNRVQQGSHSTPTTPKSQQGNRRVARATAAKHLKGCNSDNSSSVDDLWSESDAHVLKAKQGRTPKPHVLPPTRNGQTHTHPQFTHRANRSTGHTVQQPDNSHTPSPKGLYSNPPSRSNGTKSHVLDAISLATSGGAHNNPNTETKQRLSQVNVRNWQKDQQVFEKERRETHKEDDESSVSSLELPPNAPSWVMDEIQLHRNFMAFDDRGRKAKKKLKQAKKRKKLLEQQNEVDHKRSKKKNAQDEEEEETDEELFKMGLSNSCSFPQPKNKRSRRNGIITGRQRSKRKQAAAEAAHRHFTRSRDPSASPLYNWLEFGLSPLDRDQEKKLTEKEPNWEDIFSDLDHPLLSQPIVTGDLSILKDFARPTHATTTTTTTTTANSITHTHAETNSCNTNDTECNNTSKRNANDAPVCATATPTTPEQEQTSPSLALQSTLDKQCSTNTDNENTPCSTSNTAALPTTTHGSKASSNTGLAYTCMPPPATPRHTTTSSSLTTTTEKPAAPSNNSEQLDTRKPCSARSPNNKATRITAQPVVHVSDDVTWINIECINVEVRPLLPPSPTRDDIAVPGVAVFDLQTFLQCAETTPGRGKPKNGEVHLRHVRSAHKKLANKEKRQIREYQAHVEREKRKRALKQQELAEQNKRTKVFVAPDLRDIAESLSPVGCGVRMYDSVEMGFVGDTFWEYQSSD